MRFTDKQLKSVERPARYTGGELNMVRKDASAVKMRFAFAFPDIYEVGMSHLGGKIIYHLLNIREDVYCERAYAPWVDMEGVMRENAIPLCSLETQTPLNEFDIVGFTLQYELSYTNILNMLDLANIPIFSADRTSWPIVIAGGPCAYNSEPLVPFFDMFVIGDGEEVLNEISDLFIQVRQAQGSRDDFLSAAVKIEGIYVPKFYSPEYNPDNTIKSIKKLNPEAPDKIRKRVVRDLNSAIYPDSILVPYIDIVHDRIMLEVFRGCTRGCRFCQAGTIYRPVRERSVETLVGLAERLIRATGYDEISLTSLSTGDYPQLVELIMKLLELTKEKRVALSLPSLRIDSFLKGYVDQFKETRKTGLTFAPEAGSQRLRDVINKGVTDEQVFAGLSDAFSSGWDSIKLYFMLGLPGETVEDIDGIAQMARRCVNLYYEGPHQGKGVRVTVSTSSFVPKAFTPFQWCAQDTTEALKEKQLFLKGKLRGRGLDFKWNDPKLSFMEAVFSRGDRRLADVLYMAWRRGARFDGWHEHFKFDVWMEAFGEAGIDPAFYANRVRQTDENLPWDIIDCGVKKEFLIREFNCSERAEATKDCRSGCSACGMMELCSME